MTAPVVTRFLTRVSRRTGGNYGAEAFALKETSRAKTVHDELQCLRVVNRLVCLNVVDQKVVVAIFNKHFSYDNGMGLIAQRRLMEHLKEALMIRRPVGGQ